MTQQSSKRDQYLNGAATGLREVLTAFLVVFIVLRVTHLTQWPWWVVFTPLWVPLVLVGAFLATLAVLAKQANR